MVLVKYLMMCFYLHNNECLSILIVMGFKLFCASSFRRNFLIRYVGSWVVYKGGGGDSMEMPSPRLLKISFNPFKTIKLQ